MGGYAKTPEMFNEYYLRWCEDVLEGASSTLEIGKRFGQKLLTQWLNIAPDAEGLIYCDGSGDGGIDLAYLDRGHYSAEGNGNEDVIKGDTWYLVQSKYGSAFKGPKTVVDEGRKILETLGGYTPHLANMSESLLEQLKRFFLRASEKDQLVLVFATGDLLSESEQRALEDIRIMGMNRLATQFPGSFQVEAISVRNIYRRLLENLSPEVPARSCGIRMKLGSMEDEDLLVGTVFLPDLYRFLKRYKELTGDLDLLYEKNVRLYLGTRTLVNQAIYQTLQNEPHRFGLYNNGVTIVVTDVKVGEEGTETQLVEPYVVNGGQTTKMIWRIGTEWLETGGTGKHADLDSWRQKFDRGVVVVKIVKVGAEVDLLREIARFTNSQNAIRGRDFVALEEKFPEWKRRMNEKYGIFLEIQRGSQDLKRMARRRAASANAFDLLKIYGAGWLGNAGIAMGDNAPFAPPNGSIYKQIMDGTRDASEAFDEDDLYVAYQLQLTADRLEFSQKGASPSRRQTRFLFYMVVIQLLDSVLRKEGRLLAPSEDRASLCKAYTRALLKLFSSKEEAINDFLQCAAEMIDEYLDQNDELGFFTEPAYLEKFGRDLSNFLQWNKFGRQETKEDMPHFHQKLNDFKRYIGTSRKGQVSLRDTILTIIKS